LLSKGHPVGATGAAQVVEIVRQLRGELGDRQVPGAKLGLAHATGGGIAGFDHGACCIHVLSR
jgi:benzoylsuccinyl-CoA thiolase BbsB subunit